jgi:hypothetical protein
VRQEAALAQDVAVAADLLGEAEARAALAGQGVGQREPDQDQGNGAVAGHNPENPAPGRKSEHGAADAGR